MEKRLVCVFLLFVLVACGSKVPARASPLAPSVADVARAQASGTGREFSVEAFQFGFEPAEIHVKQGDTVTIHLSTRDVGHSLTIEELGVSVPALPGKAGSQTFVAGQKGSFTWRCRIPCGSGHKGMSGTLVVE